MPVVPLGTNISRFLFPLFLQDLASFGLRGISLVGEGGCANLLRCVGHGVVLFRQICHSDLSLICKGHRHRTQIYYVLLKLLRHRMWSLRIVWLHRMELDKRLVRFLLLIRLCLLDMGDKWRGQPGVPDYVARLH